MWAGIRCITFWVKMKKHGKISTYFHLKHRCGKKSDILHTVYPNINHVTNQPVITGSQKGERSGLVVECSN